MGQGRDGESIARAIEGEEISDGRGCGGRRDSEKGRDGDFAGAGEVAWEMELAGFDCHVIYHV